MVQKEHLIQQPHHSHAITLQHQPQLQHLLLHLHQPQPQHLPQPQHQPLITTVLTHQFLTKHNARLVDIITAQHLGSAHQLHGQAQHLHLLQHLLQAQLQRQHLLPHLLQHQPNHAKAALEIIAGSLAQHVVTYADASV